MSEQKKVLGQYFTVSDNLQQIVYDWMQHKENATNAANTLEPSFGAGHLLTKILEANPNYPLYCCEIDKTIKPIVNFTEAQHIVYDDFLTHEFGTKKFKTIIGNPPYVKGSKKKNLYISFIEKCFQLLDDEGELIFIVPSDFTKLTSAASIITIMTQYGSFTDFYYPDDERLFDGASIDVLVFRYQRSIHTNICNVNGSRQYCNINNGIITFTNNEIMGIKIDNLFHVYVGIVSGRDEIYRVPIGNIDVLCDKNKTEKFIFIDKWPSGNNAIDTHLNTHKNELLLRKIKSFNEKNWYKWGAPRNITSIREHWNKPCIYVRNLTRQTEVAFIGRVQYFGGSLLCLVPKNDSVNLEQIIEYLNSDCGKKDYIYSGRYKIGHKQISECNVII